MTIKQLPPNKAPESDEFTGRFYRSCWNIICTELMVALLEVHGGDSWKLGLLNSTFLTLLPKQVDAIQVLDYKLISLIHNFAKLVAKLLANRLAPRLSSLVSANQSTFIRGLAFRIISSWCSKQLVSFISKRRLVYCSNLTFPRHLTQSVGLSCSKSFHNWDLVYGGATFFVISCPLPPLECF